MAQVHYPAVNHLQECYRSLGYKAGDFPVAESAAGRILSLPLFPEMTLDQVDYVADLLSRILNGKL